MFMLIGDCPSPRLPQSMPRRVPNIVDYPHVKGTGYFAQREPGSDYKWKLMQYETRKKELGDHKREDLRLTLNEERFTAKLMKHSEHRSFQREIKLRVSRKMQEYDESFEVRRKKLLDLFWKEEREYVRETVVQAQKGAEYKFQEMEQRIYALRARREDERIKLRDEKKLQQYINGCDEFRPVLTHMRMVEARKSQLQQMKDNENRKESERELERFWHQLMLKDIAAKNEREEQDQIKLILSKTANLKTWEIQLQEKAIKEQVLAREKKEDLIRVDRIREELINEEIKNLDNKRRDRDRMLREAQEEIRAKQDLMKQRADQEKAVVRAYEQLVVEEIEREKQQSHTGAEEAKKEMMQYMDYVKRLEQERKEEEEVLESFVQQTKKEIEKRQNEAFCKLEFARRKLQQATMQGLKEQLEYKQKAAEEQLKFKQTENELLRINHDQNERLRAEYDRQQLLAALKYRDDLQKQIEHKKLLNQREREEIEHLLKLGLEEEEKYKKMVENIMKGEIKVGKVHPFTKALGQVICECPENRKFKK